MNNYEVHLNDAKSAVSRLYQEARSKYVSPPELEFAWNDAREAIRQAAGSDEELEVLLKWKSLFYEFAQFTPWELEIFGRPIWSELTLRQQRRDLLDTKPAIRAWLIQHDATLARHHAQREALALAARAADAARAQQARRAAALACWRRLASGGVTLTLNKAGGVVQAAPSALLDPADLAELASHGADLIDLLRLPAAQVAA